MNTTFKIETTVEKCLREKESAEFNDVLWMLWKQPVEKRLKV